MAISNVQRPAQAYAPSHGSGTIGAGGPDLTGLGGPPPEDPYDAFIRTLQGFKPYNATGDINAGANAELASIAQQYGIGQAQLGDQRAAGGAEIDNAYGGFQQQTGVNNADYNQRQSYIQHQVASQGAAMAKDVAGTSAGVAADLAGQGNQSHVVQNQLAATQAMLGGHNQLQADLGNRLAQVQGQAQNNTANSGALVHEGAKGTLANNYSLMLAKLQAEKVSQEGTVNAKAASARASANSQAAQFQQDILTKIASAKLDQSKGKDPMQLALQQAQLTGANLDNASKSEKLGGTKKVDLSNIGGYSSEVQKALGANGGDTTEALKQLYALNMGGSIDDNALSGYVNEITTGRQPNSALTFTPNSQGKFADSSGKVQTFDPNSQVVGGDGHVYMKPSQANPNQGKRLGLFDL